VRAASLRNADEADRRLLLRLKLADEAEDLTEEGRQFDDAWWIFDDEERARAIFRRAMLRLPVTQALIQGLHGRAAVAVAGCLHVLARHGLGAPDADTEFRAVLSVLNAAGIVAYSRKAQSFRLSADAAPLDRPNDAPVVRVIERDRPYANVRHLRELLRGCRDYIWWADPHFSRKGLEPLHEEADRSRVREIRILSGPDQTGADAVKDFRRFRIEMATLGISAEWGVVPKADRTWHDRYLITRDQSWNVPPVNTVFKGDFSEATLTPTRPPFMDWWAHAKPLIAE
jgi:hypothetical protein